MTTEGSQAPAADEAVSLRVRWRDLEETDILFADQLLISFRRGYFLLSIGQTADPQPLPGDAEEIARLRERGEIGVHPLIRVAIPEPVAAEFLMNAMNLLRSRDAAKEEDDA